MYLLIILSTQSEIIFVFAMSVENGSSFEINICINCLLLFIYLFTCRLISKAMTYKKKSIIRQNNINLWKQAKPPSFGFQILFGQLSFKLNQMVVKNELLEPLI